MKKLIISRTDSIGDVVLTLPLAGFLKSKFPRLKIVFVGRSYTQPIIEACKHVDEFVNFDKLEKMKTSEAVIRIEKLDAQAVLHVFPNKTFAKICKKAKVQMRLGTSHRVYHWFTCNQKINFTRKKSALHEAQLNFKLLIPLGFELEPTLKEIASYYGLQPKAVLSDWLESELSDNRKKVILHPKSQGSAVEWGIDNYNALIKLLDPTKYKVFITGTESEKFLVKGLDFSSDHVVNLMGKMTLAEMITFISKSDALVAASTGPLHIAAALGINAVGLFSERRPIHPSRWQPIGPKAKHLSKVGEGKGLDAEKLDMLIQTISAEDVLKAIEH